MSSRILLALVFSAALAAPLNAQFSIIVQQNGQAAGTGNGSAITLNSPGLGQPGQYLFQAGYLADDLVLALGESLFLGLQIEALQKGVKLEVLEKSL